MNKTSVSIGTKDLGDQRPGATTGSAPKLKVAKLGVVSRDYNHRFSNGFRDFSAVFSDVMKMLDGERCDTVLFSPWSIVPRTPFDPSHSLQVLQHIKAVVYEEFIDRGRQGREGTRSVVLYRQGNAWREYELPGGGFSSLKRVKAGQVEGFVQSVIPDRIMGNCCVIICGETNGVPYHQKAKTVEDDFGLRQSLPKDVTVILNPVHDWMTRFEMKLKRKFLSENNRWLISVWNKGKRDKSGGPRDARNEPWTAFHNEQNKPYKLSNPRVR